MGRKRIIPAGFSRNGVVLFHGISRIVKRAIVAIVTGLDNPSSNDKTGRMLQTWIMAADVDPITALCTGQDAAACGGCRYRPVWFNGVTYGSRECYVNIATAPLNVWRTWQRGRYWQAPVDAYPELFHGRLSRLGSYGDPAAVSVDYWAAMVAASAGHTGYTHQARSAGLRDVLEFCQVSADCAQDAQAAYDAGYGSFRVLGPDEKPLPFETVCPASAEAGKLVQCEDCLLCRGRGGGHIVIRSHGIGQDLSRIRPARRPLVLPVIQPAITPAA